MISPMKTLRKRLFALPALDGDDLKPLSFYQEHGFTAEDATEIIGQWMDLELSDDESETSEAALIHAWSILAHFGGKEGLEFLIDEFCFSCEIGDDLFIDYFPELMVAVGSEALPPLMERFEKGQEDEGTLIEIAGAVAELARNGIGKDAALKGLAGALEGNPRHRSLKGSIVCDLVDLSGDTHLAEIRQAFEDNLVDVSITGDLEDVEITLGLRSERSGPEPHWSKREAELAKASQLQRIGPRPEKGDDAGIIRYFLDLHRGSKSAQSLAEFDGLILGSILAPQAVPPSQFLPSIWDSEDLAYEPSWDDEEDAQLFLTAVMNYHNEVIRRLDDGNYFPPFKPRSQLRVPTVEESEWARGILGSVFNWGGSESEPSEAHQALMACALHLVRPTEDSPDSELIQTEHVVRAAHILRGSLDSGSPHSPFLGGFPQPQQREAPKFGRNDPCPCGSGLKYKRCCMN